MKKYDFIGESSFVSLLVFSVLVSLLIYFKPSIQEFSLKLTGIEAKLKPIEAIIAKETEPQIVENVDMQGVSMSMTGFSFSPEIAKIILALGSSKYTWRRMVGIAKETGLPAATIEKSLNTLINDGLAEEVQNRNGKLWGLSPAGRINLPSVIAWECKRLMQGKL